MVTYTPVRKYAESSGEEEVGGEEGREAHRVCSRVRLRSLGYGHLEVASNVAVAGA